MESIKFVQANDWLSYNKQRANLNTVCYLLIMKTGWSQWINKSHTTTSHLLMWVCWHFRGLCCTYWLQAIVSKYCVNKRPSIFSNFNSSVTSSSFSYIQGGKGGKEEYKKIQEWFSYSLYLFCSFYLHKSTTSLLIRPISNASCLILHYCALKGSTLASHG